MQSEEAVYPRIEAAHTSFGKAMHMDYEGAVYPRVKAGLTKSEEAVYRRVEAAHEHQ